MGEGFWQGNLLWPCKGAASVRNPQALGTQDLKFADSMDPERNIGGFSYIDVREPPEGDREAGWPRMLIENRAYASKVFRKLHMELATRQDGLQVRGMALCCMACGVALASIADSSPLLAAGLFDSKHAC